MRAVDSRLTRILAAAAALFAMGSPSAPAADSPGASLTVFAAASLTNVMQEVGAAYVEAGGMAPRFSFAASSVLARQIEAGARADVFFPADQEWMDYLASRGLIRNETRRDVLGNRLVLIAPAGSTTELRIAHGFPLASVLGEDGRLATGDPDFVPVGKYARSALTTLGVWGDVADRLVRAENVRVALAYVARGEAPLGIVYATDARAEPKVRVVDDFPADTHLPITYPVAATKIAGARAMAFISFILSERATALFRLSGFVPLAEKESD
jgi:molybdate transport system substrate-binding protein